MQPTTPPDPDNPLLAPPGPPAFDRIRVEHVVPALEWLLQRAALDFERLERGSSVDWEGTLGGLEFVLDPLERAWSTVRHLSSVRNSPELRAAHERVQPGVVSLYTRIAQSRALHDRVQALQPGAAGAALDPTRRHLALCYLRDARLAGVALVGPAKERFREIELELAALGTRFANAVLDATKAWSVTLHAAEEVAGLPAGALALAAAAARAAGLAGATAERGPWRFSLDGPSYLAVQRHARNRGLRERMLRAYVARASSGDLDNTPALLRILELRQEQARLLGYGSYAEQSLARKMAGSPGEVRELLEHLRERALPAARHELAELVELAALHGAPEARDFRPWDQAFWAERLREQRHGIEEERLREWFPLSAALAGLFALAERLFAVRVVPADGEVAVWHPDVRFFRIRSLQGEPLAAFYLDAFSRPEEKRGGAWQASCLGRSRREGPAGPELRLPIAYVCCNGTPAAPGRPALLAFSELRTLFHEFGHALQHMLTEVDEGRAAGTRNIEWDAIEVPSQFLENWLYDRVTLLGLGRHWKSGEPMPEELFGRLRAARTFLAGSDLLRQLRFALTDLELHSGFDPRGGESPFEVARRVEARTGLLEPLPEDRWLCSFTHVFSGAYAAGYYSYKWAEVLSADAFAAFEEAGLEDPEATQELGRRFRESFLALGGSRPALEVFRAFRGRDPRPEALLAHSGLGD